jgi:DNA-directed RNA polymerase subunit RPC12/RpoP
MHTCTHCGHFVTPDFVRVFGDENNVVHACTACSDLRRLMQGRGAVPRTDSLPRRPAEVGVD